MAHSITCHLSRITDIHIYLHSFASTTSNEERMMSESEIKRLASLKNKRQTFKTKQQIVRNALKIVDNNRNSKIIFDDDSPCGYEEKSPKNIALFNDDNDDEGEDVDFEKSFDATRKPKFRIIGGDERFKMDSQFNENDDQPNYDESVELEDEFTNEKKMQMQILNDVLGRPIIERPMTDRGENKTSGKRMNRMIRYDPNEDDHRNYEIEMAEEAPVSKKKRKKDDEVADEEPPPIPVSNEIFYTVSNTLADSLKTQEEFSLLKTFGSEFPAGDKNEHYEIQEIVKKRERFEPDFSNKNPFKYDSSDDDDEADSPLNETNQDEKSGRRPMSKNIPLEQCDSFFFIADDPRFKEAEEFFLSKPLSDDKFKTVRRELKEIVRSKIRNNIRKNRPWKRKTGMKSKST